MSINEQLKKYIEEKIFPLYKLNDEAHNIDHIKYVIDRSLYFASTVDNINYDMVYTIASYHDCGHHIDAKNHEVVSADILMKDENLLQFFNHEQIKMMAEAVEDHRSSLEHEPRSIYGKIVSSADRNVSIDTLLIRTYKYRLAHNPELSLEEVIESSRMHIIKKFGSKGYAREKMYFNDLDYCTFLKDATELSQNKEAFTQRYKIVNHLDDKVSVKQKR